MKLEALRDSKGTIAKLKTVEGFEATFGMFDVVQLLKFRNVNCNINFFSVEKEFLTAWLHNSERLKLAKVNVDDEKLLSAMIGDIVSVMEENGIKSKPEALIKIVNSEGASVKHYPNESGYIKFITGVGGNEVSYENLTLVVVKTNGMLGINDGDRIKLSDIYKYYPGFTINDMLLDYIASREYLKHETLMAQYNQI